MAEKKEKELEVYEPAIKATLNAEGFITDTNYWNSELCHKGFYYLTHSNGVYSLLIPESKKSIFSELPALSYIVITEGNYNEKDNCLELMFSDGSDDPYLVILEDYQLTCMNKM